MVYLRKDCILREEYHTILNRICQYCTAVISLCFSVISAVRGLQLTRVQKLHDGGAYLMFLSL